MRPQVIDGPLIDYLAKGNTVTLESLDEFEGHKAYRLGVRLATGEIDQIWIDAQTFLDIRYDRPFAGGPGRTKVSVFYRDYKAVEGPANPVHDRDRNRRGRASRQDGDRARRAERTPGRSGVRTASHT